MKKFILILCMGICYVQNFYSQTVNVNTIGEFHNVQMDKYYEKLRTLSGTTSKEKITQSDLKSLFKEVLISVYGNDNQAIIDDALNGFDACYGKTSIEIADLSINKIKTAKYNNEKLKSFLIEVVNQSKTLKSEDSNSYFDGKINEAKTLFKNGDLEIALSSLNTGKSSFAYWDKNYAKWHLLFNNSTTLARGGKAVGAADCAGFCGGALWGAMGGTAFLPGVGTVTGALAVGCANGMYASVVAGLGSAFLSIFGD